LKRGRLFEAAEREIKAFSVADIAVVAPIFAAAIHAICWQLQSLIALTLPDLVQVAGAPRRQSEAAGLFTLAIGLKTVCRERIATGGRQTTAVVKKTRKRLASSDGDPGTESIVIGPAQTQRCRERQAPLRQRLKASLRELLGLSIQAGHDAPAARYNAGAKPLVIADAR
jgi:hypothetical protein